MMMERILNIFFALVATVGIASAQSLSVQSVEVQTSQQTELAVTLSGGTSMTAMQFNLQLPAGVTANTSNATLSTAADGHTLTIETLNSGDLLFVVYSMDLKTFKDGELLRIPVTAGSTEVSSQGKLYTVRTSTTEAVSHDCADVSFAVKVKAPEQPVTITADNLTMTYGDDVPTLTYKSEGDELKGTPKLSTTATKTSPVGTYPITVKQGTVTNTQVTYVAGTLTITKAPLMVTANSYTIKQGEALPAFAASYNGFKNNETEAVLTKKPTLKTTATSDSAPGTYDITASGAEASNYDIKYVAGKLTIAEAAPITVTVKSVSREYGEVNPAFDYTVEGGTLDGKPTISCTATAKSDVGTYDINIAKGTVKNHNVTFVAGKMTITKAPLTIKAKSYSIKQGDVLPEFKAEYEGFKNGESDGVLTKQPVLTTSATSTSKPGTYDIVVSGAEAENYEISYVKGTLTIIEAEPVKVTAKSYTIEYGESIPAFEYTSEGAALSGVPEIRCSATSASAAGTYDIVVSKGSVSNFNDTYVNGTLTITKAPLTISVGEYTKQEGEENPEFELTYEGFKNGESDGVLTKLPVVTCNATKYSEPGEYVITIDGAEAENYDIRYAPGKLTVTAKETGIRNVNGNGNDDAYYTLDGKKLDTAPKKGGIYIKQGRLCIKR